MDAKVETTEPKRKIWATNLERFPTYGGQLRSDMRTAIRWLEIALQLVGIYYVGMMIKLNVYGEAVVMQFPNTPVFLTTVVNEELEEYLDATKPVRSSK